MVGGQEETQEWELLQQLGQLGFQVRAAQQQLTIWNELIQEQKKKEEVQFQLMDLQESADTVDYSLLQLIDPSSLKTYHSYDAVEQSLREMEMKRRQLEQETLSLEIAHQSLLKQIERFQTLLQDAQQTRLNLNSV